MDDTEFIFRNAETVIPNEDKQLFILRIETAVCLNEQNLNECCKTAHFLGTCNL